MALGCLPGSPLRSLGCPERNDALWHSQAPVPALTSAWSHPRAVPWGMPSQGGEIQARSRAGTCYCSVPKMTVIFPFHCPITLPWGLLQSCHRPLWLIILCLCPELHDGPGSKPGGAQPIRRSPPCPRGAVAAQVRPALLAGWALLSSASSASWPHAASMPASRQASSEQPAVGSMVNPHATSLRA